MFSVALAVDEFFALDSVGSIMKWQNKSRTMVLCIDTCGHSGSCWAPDCVWLTEWRTRLSRKTSSHQHQTNECQAAQLDPLDTVLPPPLLSLLLSFFISSSSCRCCICDTEHLLKKKRKAHLWDLLQVCHMVGASLICIPCRWRQDSAAAWLWSPGFSWICKLETKEEPVRETLQLQKK